MMHGGARRRASGRSGALSIALCTALAACPRAEPNPDGDVGTLDATLDVTTQDGCTVTDAANAQPRVRFEPSTDPSRTPPGRIPFPSVVYMAADGTVADDLLDFTAFRIARNTQALAEAYADLDGFGRNAGALFVIDSASGCGAVDVDPASLPADGAASLRDDATAFIIDLDPSVAPDRIRVPAVAGWHSSFRTIVVHPDGVTLRAGHRHAIVLTDGIRAASGGAALRASDAFIAIRDARAGARDSTLGRDYGAAVDQIVGVRGAGFDRTRIVGLAVFPVSTRHSEIRRGADAIRAGRLGGAPALVTDTVAARPYTVARFGSVAHAGWEATLDEWFGTPRRDTSGRDLPGFADSEVEGASVGLAHDTLGAVFTGVFNAPEFRGPDNRIRFAPDGSPVAVRASQQIPVTLVLPRGAVPAGGFPVVIWGHGLRNHRRHMFAIANTLARRGIAMVAIDTVTFGQRVTLVDETTLEPGTYRGRDGIGDLLEYPEADFFGRLTSLTSFRDNFRQAAFDLVQLRRLIANPALDLSFVAAEYGGVAPRLDGAHIAYVGDSLGGLIGTVFAAVEAGVNPFVLNVPGGAMFTAISTDAPTLGSLIGIIPSVLFGAPSAAPTDRFHPVLALLQIGVDASDPASLASEVTVPPAGSGARGHDVFMIESWWDEIISNRSSELIAREMRLGQLAPSAVPVVGLAQLGSVAHANLDGALTAAFFQCVPSTHGANIASRYGVRTYDIPFPRAAVDRFPRLARPFRIRQPIVSIQRAVGDFIASAFAGSARIETTGIDALTDMDDDGWLDDEERRAGTSAMDPISHPPGTAPHARDVGF